MNYQYPMHYPNTMQSHNNHTHNHHNRRRGPRMSAAQNAHRQQFVKAQRSPKEPLLESPTFNIYAKDYEAARSFEFEDDEVFCPFHLLTDDDVCLFFPSTFAPPLADPYLQLQSIHSSGSDRSSLSSGSPEASPQQHSVQPTPSFLLSTPSNFNQAAFQQNNAVHHQQQQQQRMKIHQPMAQRTRNAIPIVDPSTRTVASPPQSVSPARQMQHQYARRW